MARKFIKKAIKRPGRLRAYATRNKALNKNGTINLRKVTKIARKRGNTSIVRAANLAKTLKKLRGR